MRTTARMTTALLTAATTLAAGVTLTGRAVADDEHGKARAHEKAYEIGLVGDMPYADYGRRLYPNVLADLHRHELAFSIFDGDTKNGSESCFADAHPATATATPEGAVSTAPYAGLTGFAQGQDVYAYALDLFAQFVRPVVYRARRTPRTFAGARVRSPTSAST